MIQPTPQTIRKHQPAVVPARTMSKPVIMTRLRSGPRAARADCSVGSSGTSMRRTSFCRLVSSVFCGIVFYRAKSDLGSWQRGRQSVCRLWYAGLGAPTGPPGAIDAREANIKFPALWAGHGPGEVEPGQAGQVRAGTFALLSAYFHRLNITRVLAGDGRTSWSRSAVRRGHDGIHTRWTRLPGWDD